MLLWQIVSDKHGLNISDVFTKLGLDNININGTAIIDSIQDSHIKNMPFDSSACQWDPQPVHRSCLVHYSGSNQNT